jgi:hypothetical protein
MVIATYACCGFGSIAAIGVYIGAMISVAPERRGYITEVAFRAVINGNVAGFLTACIAGRWQDLMYAELGISGRDIITTISLSQCFFFVMLLELNLRVVRFS